MKLLVIGIDAVTPDILYKSIDEFPNIKKLADSGAFGEYDGYVYGYGSRDNWISMYTGIPPEKHGTVNNHFKDTQLFPRLYHYEDKKPFWKILNDNGYKVGMWKAISTTPPSVIDGYIASGEYALEESAKDNEIWDDKILFHSSRKDLQKVIDGEPPSPPFPPGPEKINKTWSDIKQTPEFLLELMTEDYFDGSLEYLNDNLKYHLQNIKKVNEVEQVDLFWFYDLFFDFISHFQMHDPNKKVIIKALKIIDQFVGELIEILNPENVIFISDHGQLSFGDHFPNCSIEVKKETFGLAEQSIFIDDFIFLPARNGGVLTSAHAMKGTLICSGPLFKKMSFNRYRTLDIYPLILEIFDCDIPCNREGYIPDILVKNYKNKEKIFPSKPDYREVLLIANMPVYDMNAFINQYYLHNRFDNITVFTDNNYKSIYEKNPQVQKCLTSKEDFSLFELQFSEIIVPMDRSKYGLKFKRYLGEN